MAVELYNDGDHKCLKFNDLTGDGEIQSNQFLLINKRRGLVIDCGGYRIFSAFLGEISRYLPAGSIDCLFLSHQDPDIGSGLNLWLPITPAQIMVSQLWTRFIPAFCVRGLSSERITPLPDHGMKFKLGDAELMAVPAHFMHSPGNFHLYDPTSKILFTGDLGASVGTDEEMVDTMEGFNLLLPKMAGFHNRYISSAKACKAWAAMVRQLDVEMIVPQHGARLVGKELVEAFYQWVETEKTALDDHLDELFKLPV